MLASLTQRAPSRDHLRRHDLDVRGDYSDDLADPSATEREFVLTSPVARIVAAAAAAAPAELAGAEAALRPPRLGCAAARAGLHGRSLSADAGAMAAPPARPAVARRFFSERRLVPRTTCRDTPVPLLTGSVPPPRRCPCCSDSVAAIPADTRTLTWPGDSKPLACERIARPNDGGGDYWPATISGCGAAESFSALPPSPLSSRIFCDASFFDNFRAFVDDAGDSIDEPDEPVYESVRYHDDDGDDDFDVVEHSDFYRKSTAARLHSAPPALPPRPPYLLFPPPPPTRPPPPPSSHWQQEQQPKHHLLTASRSLPDIAPVNDAPDDQREASAAVRCVVNKRRPAGLELWANRIQMGVAARRAWEEKYVIKKLGRE